jgi:polysaccharide export outer membrane protein
MGEVNGPRALEMRDGRLSLNDALGEVGGLNPQSAAARQVFVVRPAGAGGKPQVFHLDAKSPVALAYAEGFALQPKDVVFVDSSSLVRWNRVISLVLPTTGGIVGTAVGISQTNSN